MNIVSVKLKAIWTVSTDSDQIRCCNYYCTFPNVDQVLAPPHGRVVLLCFVWLVDELTPLHLQLCVARPKRSSCIKWMKALVFSPHLIWSEWVPAVQSNNAVVSSTFKHVTPSSGKSCIAVHTDMNLCHAQKYSQPLYGIKVFFLYFDF